MLSECFCVFLGDRYGILLLVVECMGASTVMTYGLWLLYNPVQEDFVEDPMNPGKPKVGAFTTSYRASACMQSCTCDT